MSWIGVVTNAGDALLAQWAGGSETLYITKATVGSGYVAEANMWTATALQAEKDTAAIVENKAVGNYGRKLRLRVGPNDTAGYTAHEIGLWGKLGANGTETLIQLHQDDDEGVPVPKSSESPEFVFDLIAVLATSNTASLTVNLDSSVYVTELQLEETETELGFNPDVMKAAIMAVSGVTHVLIRLNRSNTTVDGIPAGKINVLVSGGAKASICQAIYDTNTSGLETYGTLSAEISGETISFSRVTLMPVHVRVQLQGLEEPDITDVAADIKHNIFQYINYTLNVGESLEVSRIRDLVNDGLGSLTGNIEIMDIYVSGAHGISRGIITTEWNKKFTLTATTEIELSTTTTATSDAIANISSKLREITNRGRKDIRNSLVNLPTAISEQNLEKYGYQVGDYFDASGFTNASGYRYTIADVDTFYGYNSYAVVWTHHITLIVDTNTNVKWNSSNDTSTGYVGSNLHSYLVDTVLPKVKTDIAALFGGAWSDHIIGHQKLYSTGTGSWAWSSGQYIAAPTSVQWHGSPICDMNFYHTGEGNKPLEVFQRYFYPEIMGNQNNWLRSVASASCPAFAYYGGAAFGDVVASIENGAVGLIIFH